MGQRTDPGYELFGDDCLTCFDANKTPQLLFVEFAGIDWQVPPDPGWDDPLPNAMVLEQDTVTPCLWKGGAPGDIYCTYQTNLGPGSRLYLAFNIYSFFGHTQAANCVYEFTNQYAITPPLILGENGTARIWTRPGVDLPSLKHIMELINMEPERKNWHDGFPIDAQFSVSRYVREQDATNIKIKFDHT